MKRVYLVMAEYTYEGSNVVRAYATNGGAARFVQRVRAHIEKRPGPPPIENTPENDAWWTKHCAWEKRHPAKHHTGADSFSVSVWKITPEVHSERTHT